MHFLIPSYKSDKIEKNPLVTPRKTEKLRKNPRNLRGFRTGFLVTGSS